LYKLFVLEDIDSTEGVVTDKEVSADTAMLEGPAMASVAGSPA
jgi:hypothetical protein